MLQPIRQLIAGINRLAATSKMRATSQNTSKRSLALETLENRELLSIGTFSVAQFQSTFAAYEGGAAVQSKYADLKLANELNNYNLIDICWTSSTTNSEKQDDFSKAIENAYLNPQQSIITVRYDGNDNGKVDGNDKTYHNSINVNGIIIGNWSDVNGYIRITSAGSHSGAVTIIGLGGGLTIDGQNAGNRIFNVAAGNTLGLANITITGGYAKTRYVGNSVINTGYGGAIWNEGNLYITNCTITGNTAEFIYQGGVGNLAEARGGGIYNAGTTSVGMTEYKSTLIISNSTISDNTTSTGHGNSRYGAIVTAAYGGGIYSGGEYLEIRNSNVTGNRASATNGESGQELVTNAYGGGIYQTESNGTMILTGCNISGNTAEATNTGSASYGIISDRGGEPIRNDKNQITGVKPNGWFEYDGYYDSNPMTWITGDLGEYARASAAILTGAYGGGVYVTDDALLVEISNCTIDDNNALATNSGNATNSAASMPALIGVDAYGGGIYWKNSATTRTVTIINSSVSGNTAKATNSGSARSNSTHGENSDFENPNMTSKADCWDLTVTRVSQESIQVSVYVTALGGGIFNSSGTDLTVTGSHVDGNKVETANSGKAEIPNVAVFGSPRESIDNWRTTVTESAGAGIYNGSGYDYKSDYNDDYADDSNIATYRFNYSATKAIDEATYNGGKTPKDLITDPKDGITGFREFGTDNGTKPDYNDADVPHTDLLPREYEVDPITGAIIPLIEGKFTKERYVSSDGKTVTYTAEFHRSFLVDIGRIERVQASTEPRTLTVDSSTISGNSAISVNNGDASSRTSNSHSYNLSCSPAWALGGGLYNGEDIGGNSSTTVTVTNSEMADNTVAARAYGTISVALGGAVFNAANTITVTNVDFVGNKAMGASREGIPNYDGSADLRNGGAIYNGYGFKDPRSSQYYSTITIDADGIPWSGDEYDAPVTTAVLNLSNSWLDGNEAQLGGAVYNSGTANIDNSTLTANHAVAYEQNFAGTTGSGGAIFNDDGDITVKKTTLENNTADRRGGAVFNRMTPVQDAVNFNIWKDAKAALFGECSFVGNNAMFGGAAVNEGTLTMSYSTFKDNTAVNGGAVWNTNRREAAFSYTYDPGSGYVLQTVYANTVLNVDNSLFYGNYASGQGGAVYNHGIFTAVYTTIAYNEAGGYGGGVYNTIEDSDRGKYQSKSSFYNSIVIQNIGTSDGSQGVQGDIVNDGAKYYAAGANPKDRPAGIIDGAGLLSTIAAYSNSQDGTPYSQYNFWGGNAANYFRYDASQKPNGAATDENRKDYIFNDAANGDFTLYVLYNMDGTPNTTVNPAIDKAADLTSFGVSAALWATDKNGLQRPQGTQNDLGAYESPFFPSAPSGLDFVLNSSGLITLSWNPPTFGSGFIYVLQVKKPGQNTFEVVNASISAVSFQYDFTNEVEGDYVFRVRAVNNLGYSSAYSGTLTVTCDKPATPAPFTWSYTNGKLVLSWTPPAKVSEDYTLVRYKKDNAGNWVVDYTYLATAVNKSSSSFEVADIERDTVNGVNFNTEYRFELTANNGYGHLDPAVVELLTVPTTVTGFQLDPAGTQTYDSVPFVWNTLDNITGYELQWRVYDPSQGADAGWRTELPAPAPTANIHTAKGLPYSSTNTTTYEFRLAATNLTGTSPWTPGIIVELPPGPPAQPTGFVVKGATSTTITLSWTAQNDAVRGYQLSYREVGATGNWKICDVVPTQTLNTWTVTVPGLSANKEYEFELFAKNDSHFNSKVTVITGMTMPPIPFNFTATPPALNISNAIDLSWSAVAGVTYQLRYKISAGNTWSAVIAIPANNSTWTVQGLNPDTEYDFELKAVGSDGNKVSDAIIKSAKTNVGPSAAPAGLTAEPATASPTDSITLTWTKPDGAASYTLGYKKSGDSTWTTYTSNPIGGDLTSVTVTGLDADTVYQFRLTADNSGGSSGYSVANAATMPKAPDKPTGFQVKDKTAHSVTLSWTRAAATQNNSLPATYTLEYKKSTDSEWELFSDTINGSLTTTTVTGLQQLTEYQFRLTAVNVTGTATAGNIVTATTLVAPPAQPAHFTATPADNSTDPTTSVTLNWDAQPNLTGYALKYWKTGTSNVQTWTAPASGATTATITGLDKSAGYTFELTAVNALGEAAATVTATTLPVRPTAPKEFISTAQTGTTVTLTWTKQAGLTHYELTYRAGAGILSAPIAIDKDAVTYTVTGLAPETAYTFILTAINDLGRAAATTTATTPVAPPAPPVNPEYFQAAANKTTSDSVTLTWNAQSGLTGYSLEYSTDGGANWLPYATSIAGNPDNIASITVTGLQQSTAYTFRLTAKNGLGTAEATATATTLAAKPAAPVSFKSTSQTTNSVTLTWDAQNNLTGYVLQYKKTSDTAVAWTSVPVPGTAATVTVTGLDSGTAYEFYLTATNVSGDSTPAEAKATTKSVNVNVPSAPADFEATTVNKNSVTLSWTKPGGTITGYKLEYKEASDGGWSLATAPGTAATSATITSLAAGTAYKFRLTAIIAGVDSLPAEADATTTIVDVATPSEPSNFATTIVTAHSVTLTWLAQSGLTGYVLQYRKSSESNWTTAPKPAVGDTSATITGLDADTTYYRFRLAAVNAAGPSGYATATATTPVDNGTPPTAPAGFRASAVTKDSVTLSWTAQSGLTGYVLQYRLSGTAGWTPATAPAVGATSATVSGLQPAAKYDFQLVAANGSGVSPAANLSNVSTQDEAGNVDTGGNVYQPPKSVEATQTKGKEATSATVTWEASPLANSKTKYVIQYREVNGNGKWKSVTVKSSAAGMLSKDLKLASGKTYEFQVYVKGEKGGPAQSGAERAEGTVRTWAVLKAASLAVPKATELPIGFKSQEQVAVKVKNFIGTNAIGTSKSSFAVDTLTVTYTGASAPVEFKFEDGVWKSNNANVTFEKGIIWIKDLRPQTKYTVTVQFSNLTAGQEATSKSASKKAFSTTKANWHAAVVIDAPVDIAAQSGSVSWEAATDDFGNSAVNYTVKFSTSAGKVVKKIKATGTSLTLTASHVKSLAKYADSLYVTVIANADGKHVVGSDADATSKPVTF